MIGKISTGGGARGLLDYLLNPKRERAEREQEREHEQVPEREPAEREHEIGDDASFRGARGRELESEGDDRGGRGKAEEERTGVERGAENERGERVAEDGPAYRDGSRARIIGGNLSGRDARELAREFDDLRALRPDVKNTIHHASISLKPGEHLTVEQWNEVAARYVSEMGYERSAYVVVQHRDEKHEHIHIVASNITVDGEVVPQYRNYERAETVMRSTEREYGLEQVAPSREAMQRAPTGYEIERFEETGERSTRMFLQDTIDRALRDAPTTTEFVRRMERNDVRVNANIRDAKQVLGISFEHGGEEMKGSDLGRGYSWHGLQRNGLEYDERSDLAALREAKVAYLEARLERYEARHDGELLSERFAGRAKLRDELAAARASMIERTAERVVPEREAETASRAADARHAPAQETHKPVDRVPARDTGTLDRVRATPLEPARAANMGRGEDGRPWRILDGETETANARDALARAVGYDTTRTAEELLREAVEPAHTRDVERDVQKLQLSEPERESGRERTPDKTLVRDHISEEQQRENAVMARDDTVRGSTPEPQTQERDAPSQAEHQFERTR